MPLYIGVTGGIGSGKTTVCRIFQALGVPVYYADDRAKQIIHEKKEVKERILEAFGPQAYLEDGSYHRAFIASVVFKDKEKLQTLNSIVHPAVFQDSIEWQQEHIDAPYTIKEAALLFESGSYKMLDKIITVTAPEDLRIERVMKRDHTDEQSVKDRISKQLSEEEKVSKSDFIIVNDGNQLLIPQVVNLHNFLMILAKSKEHE